MLSLLQGRRRAPLEIERKLPDRIETAPPEKHGRADHPAKKEKRK
jgi:hypothetical protein